MTKGEDWWLPVHWPVGWRRAFLLTLPISGTVWCAVVAVCGVTLLIVGLIGLGVVMPIVEMWQRKPSERVGRR